MNRNRHWIAGLLGLAALGLLGGCPTSSEFIAGGTGDRAGLGNQASVQVISPISDLAITGGTAVEVNWAAVATTNFSELLIIFDLDETPDNGNETVMEENIALTESTAVIDTTNLEGGTYNVGVVLFERNALAAFDYAPGRITINQRTQFFFSRVVCLTEDTVSPPDNFLFDRTERLTPQFFVEWTLNDPDSTVHTRIFLDPDDAANGNEFLLRESDEQTTDSFTFDLPTALFEPGVYRFLAIVSDGIGTAEFYSPSSIRLRSRLAGVVDLRDMHLPESGISGAVFEGFNPRDNLGSFVSSTRDLDVDGFEDFVMLAQFGKPGYFINAQRGGVGEAYIVHGRADRFSGVINVNSIGALFRGWVYEGVPEVVDPLRPSRGVTSFAVLSDWDLDGVREFAFGMPFTDSLPVSLLDSTGYFRTGGVVVASSSSLRPDLGFPGSNPVYVLGLGEFGTMPHEPLEPDPPPPPCVEGFIGPKAPAGSFGGQATYYHRHLADFVGTPNAGSIVLGCRLSSNGVGDQFGESISAYEYDSIIISSPNTDPGIGTIRGPSLPGAGVIYVFYNATFVGNWPWSNVQAPAGNDAFNYAGMPEMVAADLIPHGGPYHYIIADARMDTTSLLPASPGYYVDPDDSTDPCERTSSALAPRIEQTVRIWGQFAGGRLSNAKGIGDFNSDGIRDLVVGVPLSNEGDGALYVVLGRFRNLVIGGELPVEELGLPMNAPNDPEDARVFDGIRIVGAPGTRLGSAQDRAGDFNGDGLGDVLVGSPLLNNRRGGAAVFFGSRTVINLTQEEIPFLEIPERELGVVFVGETEGDLAGACVAAAGDVDGDGLGDILIAAPDRSVRLDVDLDGVLEIDRTECGVVYLIYGSSNLGGRMIELANIGTAELPGAVFIGRNSGDHLGAGLGEQGDRSVGIASAGDVDGDARTDLLMSSVFAAPRDRSRAGEVYLIYGAGDE